MQNKARSAIGSDGWECSVVIAMLTREPEGEVWSPLRLPEDGIKHSFSHNLSVSLYYLRVTRATGARTTRDQSGFLRRDIAVLRVWALSEFSKHHQSSFPWTTRQPAHVSESKQDSEALSSTDLEDEDIRGDGLADTRRWSAKTRGPCL